MSRQSIQKIKAMLLCIEYGILFVDTVDTKIKAMHLMLCLSTLSTLVFVALTQHLMQVWKLCIKWPLAPAKREGYCIVWAFHLGGLAVHQSVRGGSFVNFLGLVKLQGWLQARCTANPQFLKLKGTQQPGNSYKSMTKLHPPYPNWTCHK